MLISCRFTSCCFRITQLCHQEYWNCSCSDESMIANASKPNANIALILIYHTEKKRFLLSLGDLSNSQHDMLEIETDKYLVSISNVLYSCHFLGLFTIPVFWTWEVTSETEMQTNDRTSKESAESLKGLKMLQRCSMLALASYIAFLTSSFQVLVRALQGTHKNIPYVQILHSKGKRGLPACGPDPPY